MEYVCDQWKGVPGNGTRYTCLGRKSLSHKLGPCYGRQVVGWRCSHQWTQMDFCRKFSEFFQEIFDFYYRRRGDLSEWAGSSYWRSRLALVRTRSRLGYASAWARLPLYTELQSRISAISLSFPISRPRRQVKATTLDHIYL